MHRIFNYLFRVFMNLESGNSLSLILQVVVVGAVSNQRKSHELAKEDRIHG
jgi:hypothetical protein